MDHLRFPILVILLTILSLTLFAGGKKEFDGKDVNGKENWDFSYDLTDQKPGQYNLIIEGTDKAGNTSIAGPFNVWIDPNSDIPIVSVINPIAGQRVGQNLNIVGTCVDDDAVDHVEIQLDGGESFTATGTDYWSYYLNGNDIADGVHSLSITGYDIKGVKSKPVVVSFNLDKFKPINSISSHENGVLVSGQVKLKGSVSDANSVANLAVSLDSGKTYKNINFNPGKDATTIDFQLDIDTRTMKDGPNVFWFRSTDKTHSLGISAFLLMVDNTKPAIRIINPLPSMTVHGKTGIAGMIFDSVGVQSLSYDFNGKTIELSLFPGNPFFSSEIDLSGIEANDTLVTFHAVDRAGNRQELKYPLKIDNEPDLPVIDLQNLRDKEIIPADYDLAVSIHDDDGVNSFLYVLDKEAEQELPAKESAMIALRSLAGGPHSLIYRARDSLGTLGHAKTVSFVVKSAPPVIKLTTLQIDGSPRFITSIPNFLQVGDQPMIPGLRILQDGANKLKGSITAGNRLKLVEFQIEDQKPLSVVPVKDAKNPDSYDFTIELPKNLHFGPVKLTLKAVDEYDQIHQVGSLVQVINYSRINEEPAVVFLDSRIKNDGLVPLSATHPLEGLFVGSDAQSIRLDPPSDSVKATLDGNRIIISYLKDGLTKPSSVVVLSKEKHEVRSAPLIFRSDSNPPAIVINQPASGSFVKTNLELRAKIDDLGGIDSVAWSLDQGTSWNPIAITNGTVNTQITQSISLEAIADGPLTVLLKVADGSGNESIRPLVLIKDVGQPVITFDSPLDRAWGFTPVFGRISDLSRLASLEYKVGTGAWQSAGPGTPDKRFILPVDFGSDRTEAIELAVKAVDSAGNESLEIRSVQAGPAPEAPPELVPDAKGKLPDPPKPRVIPLSPGSLEGVHGKISVLFQLADYLPAYPIVRFSGPGINLRDISTEIRNGYFLVDLDLSTVKSATANCNFEFETETRKKTSLPITIKLNLESDRPTVKMVWQDASATSVAAFGDDDDGIQKLSATVNGKPVEFVDNNSASLLNLPDLPVGTHTLAVWSIDTNGLASAKLESKFNSRDKAPSLQLGTISQAGSASPFVNGMSLVLGKDDRLSISASYPAGFKGLEYRLNGLAGTVHGSVSGTVGKLEIPLPPSLPWGLNSIELIATGTAGLTDQRQVFFYHLAAPDPQTVEGVAIVIDTSGQNPDGTIPISPQQPLNAFFTGRPIKSVAIAPATPDLEAAFSGNMLTVVPKKPILAGPRHFVVTDIDGDSFNSADFIVQYDPIIPAITLSNTSGGAWVQKVLAIKGTVSENLGIRDFQYAVRGVLIDQTKAADDAGATAPATKGLELPTMGDFAPLDLAPLAADGSRSFQAEIDLTAYRDGIVTLAIRATDTFGNSIVNYWPFSKDTAVPLLVQLTPPETEKVNGRITTTGKARDAGRLVQVEFSSDEQNWTVITNSDIFSMDLDFGAYARLPSQFWWRATDAAGNVALYNPSFNIDQESDKPVVTVQTPSENETIRNDFKISGIAFDDDGIKNLYYRLDHQEIASQKAETPAQLLGPTARPSKAVNGILLTDPRVLATQNEEKPDLSSFTKLDGKSSFDLAMVMLSVGDNEHLFEIVGEDINGTFGHVFKRPFRISTAEPTSQLDQPLPGVVIRDTLRMSGSASDKNGVMEVWLSFDSGNSWAKAEGTVAWHYDLDTTTLKDGVHSVIIKTIDMYDTEGLYNTIITTDNSKPVISLDTPVDGVKESGMLRLSGRISDNLNLAKATVLLVPADNPIRSRTDSLVQDLSTKTVLQHDLDISKLTPGWYTLRIEVTDQAENTTWISRDIQIVETKQIDQVEILFPIENEVVNGFFTIAGQVSTSGPLPEMVQLMVSNAATGEYQPIGEYPVSKTGHFNANIDPGMVADGLVEIVAVIPNSSGVTADEAASTSTSGTTISSQGRHFNYRRDGAWIQFGNFASGDYLAKRTFLKGTAGFYLEPAMDATDQTKTPNPGPDKKITSIQVSYDHGTSWQAITGSNEWSYRIETQNYPNGRLYLLFRLIMQNGDSVVRHAIMVVDKTPPLLTVLKPGEEGRFNEKLDIAGTASDNYELDTIKVLLRIGDKANYSVPSFIQGLYLDGHYGGASTWEGGLGLTFFDNNVKLQALIGQAPADTRFDGWVLGVKLIANVLYMPFSYFFGPDMDFFSMSVGLGAQFNYMTMSGAEFVFSDKGLVLGAALLQWEFARFTFADLAVFKTIGLYVEGQAWFISSDVQASVMPKVAFGARVNIF